MTKIDDGGPAFPKPHDPYPNCQNTGDTSAERGMSLRDWFAGQFLSGAIGEDSTLPVPPGSDEETIRQALREHWGHVAVAAYIAADAMLAERSKERQP